jgi:hypothetical protein
MTLLSGTLSAPAVMSALYSNVTAFGLLGVLSGLWLQTIPPHRLDCTGLASNCKTSHFAALFCILEANSPFDAIPGKVGSPFCDRLLLLLLSQFRKVRIEANRSFLHGSSFCYVSN